MPLQQSRRAFLRASGVAATAAVAGCSMLPGGGSDPDAGTDSYGVLATNDTAATHEVVVTATDRGSGQTAFERTASVAPDGSHEWDGALTEDGLYRVEATVNAENFFEHAGNARSVTVGAQHSVEAKNIEVLIRDHEGVTTYVQLDSGP